MKNIIFLMSFFFSGTFFSQNYYDQQWKKVEENYKKGVYKNNLPIISEIQKQAMKDNNALQIIKSLKAEFSITNQTQDDSQNDAASQFFKKLKTIENQLKGDDYLLFKVLLGEFFSEYYENNAWEINERTNLNNQDFSQIENWSTLDFNNFLAKNYVDLEKENAVLKKISMQKYKSIFESAENIDYFPTLFDWKSFNEIDFLRNAQLFTPNELKANYSKINTIFDELIAINSTNPKLYFQHQKLDYNCGFFNCKDRFEQLEKLVKNEATAGDYKVKIVADLMLLLQQKNDFKTALIWANKAKKINPDSKFQANISNIENAIKSPSLFLNYEKQTQPNKPIHLVAEGKNVDQFSLNIYEVKDDLLGFMNFAFDEYRFPFKTVKKSLVRKDLFDLKNNGDFKKYKTSLDLKALSSGIYLAEYVVENAIQASFYFLVSDTKVIDLKKNDVEKKSDLLKLVNNETGKSLANQKIELYEFVHNGKLTKFDVTTDSNGGFRFPENKSNEYYRNYLIKNSDGNYNIVDVYGRDAYYNPSENDFKKQAQIFLDRAIYRPGQTVYFKVINTKLDDKKELVNPNMEQKISLFDANGEKIAEQTFKTNDFGSYHGNFVLPKGKLNGSFSLRIEEYAIEGYKNFQVEEYKRPKFEVTFEPIKDEYKYGETIEIKGKAMMFSGVALSNSSVNYEIKKENIRWRYFWWFPPGNGNENSILGTVQTNEKGEFTIKLNLKKDEKLDGIQIDNYAINASVTDINGETQSAETDLKVASVSHYISADQIGDVFSDEITKVKVETKNYNEQNVQKSYTAKLSKLEEPKRIFRNNFQQQIQDLPVFSKNEFEQKFPHDTFNKDETQEKWKIEKVVFEKIQDTRTKNQESRTENQESRTEKQETRTKNQESRTENQESRTEKQETRTKNQESRTENQESRTENQESRTEKQEPRTKNQESRTKNHEIILESQILNLGSLIAGTYKLELFNIEEKDTIKTQQIFNVWDKKSLKDSQKPFLKVIQPKKKFKRGEKAKIFVYSAVPNALANIFIQNGKGETITENHHFKNGILEYETIIPTDESISQMNVQFQVVAFNDVQTQTIDLKIETNEKPLKIETITFRDKLQPNSKEKWTVKILGEAKEKINAEVLANMYDMSLDQFAVNTYSWQKLFVNPYFVVGYDLRQNLAQEYFVKRTSYKEPKEIYVPQFSWFDGGIYSNILYENSSIRTVNSMVPSPMKASKMESLPASTVNQLSGTVAGLQISSDSALKTKDIEEVVQVASLGRKKEDLDKIPVRQNLNETAFFYPNLMTDSEGNISFEFTSPEALTQWKLMFLAHTKDARSAVLEKKVITQKEFSITPNYPRFLREGDELNLQSKLSSLVNQKLSGVAQLQILDAFTNEDITAQFLNTNSSNSFELSDLGNSVVNWKVKVPKDVSSIIIKIVAKAGNFSDGEQKAIAILPNRMLVTDAVPIFVKEGQTKTFVLEHLKSNQSQTISNVSNTLELTTNPIWEIMFALPSLKNDTNNSADVVFNKWFADVLASEIFKANPKLKTVFDEYQSKGLLTSNLEKNQELKQLLLEETPWVLESKNETQQMEKMAKLFDANTMRNSIQQDWSELQQLQNPNGGFSWYAGYPSSYYTSLYILKNLGKINDWLKGNVKDYQSSEQKEMVVKLISYVDNEVNKYWKTDKDHVWNNFVIDYLDTRNYWEKEYPLKNKGANLKTLVITKAKKAEIKDFTFFGLHRAALLFNNYGLKEVSNKLMIYLKETSTNTETQGVYWKQNLNDWGWYSSKTVNHAGALEAFNKLNPIDENFIEEMKIWLITQKEVNSWGSSRGTAEVIFTILNSGKSWTSVESDKAEINWGEKDLYSFPQSSATGYFKTTVVSDKLNKNLATVSIKKDSPGIVHGGLFWQYYEDLDKIKSSETYISIAKELYKKVKTVNGEELVKIAENSPLKVGDKVTVRMIFNTDRNMEFIHLKDMRAAGFEPLNVISGYEWKNNLGYYQSTKDASTNFFIEYLPKGKYVFEYDYVANASGKFSNGITTLQNYYAPQMNAHTQGSNVLIQE